MGDSIEVKQLLEQPRNVAQLNIRVGRVGFDSSGAGVVGSGFYRPVEGRWFFYRSMGKMLDDVPEFGDMRHPGLRVVDWGINPKCVWLPRSHVCRRSCWYQRDG